MKHNWNYKRLGDICTFERGITYSKEDESEQVSDIIVLRSNNIDLETNSLNFSDLKYLNKDFRTNNDKKLRANSILICLSNGSLTHLGKTAYVERNYDMMFGGFMGLIVPKQQNPRYISYIFRSPLYFKFIDSLNRGANIRNLQISKLSNLSIPVPPMEVQEQIVAELDKINEVIGNCRELLRNLDALAQSLFYDTFGDPVTNPKGWPIAQMKDISSLITNGTTPKGGQSVYVDSGITFFRSQNVWRNKLVMDDVAYLDEETNASMKGSMLHHNDILITKTGRVNTENSSLGRSALFTGEDNTANINGHVYLVRLKDSAVPRFVLEILLSKSYRDLIRKVCVGAIDKRQLNLSHIEQFPIIMPPITLQKQFVAQVERIEAQKKAVEAAIAELQTLLNSRMDYWFN